MHPTSAAILVKCLLRAATPLAVSALRTHSIQISKSEHLIAKAAAIIPPPVAKIAHSTWRIYAALVFSLFLRVRNRVIEAGKYQLPVFQLGIHASCPNGQENDSKNKPCSHAILHTHKSHLRRNWGCRSYRRRSLPGQQERCLAPAGPLPDLQYQP